MVKVAGILAAALTKYPPKECLFLYLKLKDAVFRGIKPYIADALELFLKNHFGERALMRDLTGPRYSALVRVRLFYLHVEWSSRLLRLSIAHANWFCSAITAHRTPQSRRCSPRFMKYYAIRGRWSSLTKDPLVLCCWMVELAHFGSATGEIKAHFPSFVKRNDVFSPPQGLPRFLLPFCDTRF